jgi:hypothetical protein
MLVAENPSGWSHDGGRRQACLRTVSIRAIRDVQDDDGASVLSDPVANMPVRPTAGRILPGILIPHQMADAVRVLQQRAR